MSAPPPPVADPGSPPPPGGPSRWGSLGLFVLGLTVAVIGMAIAASLGARVSLAMVCVAELVAFLSLLVLMLWLKRRALLAGFLTGVALVILLCAACYGLIRSWGR